MGKQLIANIGKLLLATKIYDMHRLAHTVSGGLIVCLPGPDEDHNPATAGDLAAVLSGAPGVGYQQRADVSRLMEDLTASYTGGWYSTISLHGGGSPEAMKREIHRNYPIEDRTRVVRRLLERGVLAGNESDGAQPGQCCDDGCVTPNLPKVSRAQQRP